MESLWSRERWAHIGLISAVAFALYGAGFAHEFHLDSAYGLVKNSAIRSLDMIPSYFVDPFTLTSVRSNADYRPVLQVTYALNYAMSGYEMWSWHLVQVLLHIFNAACLMMLVSVLLPRMVREPTMTARRWLPLLVGVLFVVHPTASGVVNYIWARSSLLTAALLLPAILCFIRGRVGWASFLYGLALFTKVEAIGAIGVFAMWLVVLAAEARSEEAEGGRGGFLADLGCLFRLDAARDLAPVLVITGVYLGIRAYLLPDFLAEVRSEQDMTTLSYFATQLTAWWYYLGHWWAPVGLVADHLGYPVFGSLLEPMVVLAAAGWIAALCILGLFYQERPVYAFLAVSALALISPHSSFLPLSEMVNEHRPYLPIGVLSLCWLVPAGHVILRRGLQDMRGRVLGVLVFITPALGFAAATVERNSVFETWESYWTDVARKAPSWRAHLNLGWWEGKRGEYEKAEAHYKKSLEFAPYNLYAHSNLARIYARTDRHQLAKASHDRAVKFDHHTSIALEARADYFMKQERYQEAADDLAAALPRTMDRYGVYVSLATALAHLRDWSGGVDATLKAKELDSERASADIVSMIRPFWRSDEHARAGLKYFELLEPSWRGQWWIYGNWSRLAAKLGLHALAERKKRAAERLKERP